MRIYDIIAKKRDGGTHTRAELETLINGYVAGDRARLPDGGLDDGGVPAGDDR